MTRQVQWFYLDFICIFWNFIWISHIYLDFVRFYVDFLGSIWNLWDCLNLFEFYNIIWNSRDFLAFMESKSCLHQPSNYYFFGNFCDLFGLFCADLIWFDFFSNFLKFSGIFQYLWHRKICLHKLQDSQKGI